MFTELARSLNLRGVSVGIACHYSARHERLSYRAKVTTINDLGIDRSWPSFEFEVGGRDLDEIADDIKKRLHLVEPIIAAREKHRQHKDAVREADRIGKELRDICVAEEKSVNQIRSDNGMPPLEPNLDPKTARERPVKLVAHPPGWEYADFRGL
ncbi:hypothetical protein HJB67_12880 [Rhizobium lentis]|uniref:hypothetical protein n=1 Tax=Rhizobium lentis TaxID=1138194 RepID=UPI001C82A654|nr:hypothetical protein [Rhizobium lentis]MBX5010849.1 hypothetical protein [Rhizobium lentis]